MCIPKTKIEREVDRLHRQLPKLNKRQIKWAIANCTNPEWAHKYYGKNTSIEHFIVATTKNDWQVLRHFYLYGTYRKRELVNTEFLDIMEQWYKQGNYVFYCRPRFGMSYCNDAWCRTQPMSIKRGSMESRCLIDPRELAYCDVLYDKVLPQFSYITDLHNCNVGKVWRAVNIDPIWETIFKQNLDEYIWCAKKDITISKEKTIAVRIARRHHYDYQSYEWLDLLENLIYLRKDIRNPKYVCPKDLRAVHDEMYQLAVAKREKLRKMAEATREIRAERNRLRRMREMAEQEQNAIKAYPKARKRFFGVIIEGQGIEIKCLQSVDEFMQEGLAMKHCVFGNAYYDMDRHPNSLILSAKKDGERAETIEVDLRDYRIVQSRGKCNQPSPYHDTIVQLMNDNMGMIREANTRKRKAV